MRMLIDPAARARIATATLLVLVFLAGSLTGMAAKEVLAARSDPTTAVHDLPDAPSRRPPPGPPGAGFWLQPNLGGGYVDILSARLDLNDEQRGRITTILIEQRNQLDESLRQMRPQFESHLLATRAAIRAVLTAEQRTRFDRLEAEHRESIMRRRQQLSPDSPFVEASRLRRLPR